MDWLAPSIVQTVLLNTQVCFFPLIGFTVVEKFVVGPPKPTNEDPFPKYPNAMAFDSVSVLPPTNNVDAAVVDHVIVNSASFDVITPVFIYEFENIKYSTS